MENLRNFCIISHVNHGKSTLSDRFLEITQTIPKEKMREQFLNLMDLEREKGITIKMQPVRMEYALGPNTYHLNLIDTPGHVDFSYEVSKSLAAVEGAILLVDATKGIQAQTLANLELAKKQNLVIIPAINKIDMPQARTEETKKDLSHLLNISPEEIFLISAKLGTNVKELLETVIEKVPPPKGDKEKPLRALIFSSKYDAFKGIIAYVRVVEGKIKAQDKIYLIQSATRGEAKEVGFFKPEFKPTPEVIAGEIGYIATGIKEPEKIRVGDTISLLNSEVEPLPGYEEPKPMVFLSIYPENADNLDLLKDSLEKLQLLDTALIFKPELKEGLGRGFQCGFLGLLHAEIISERLRREFGLELVLSTPSVIYKVIKNDNKEIMVYTASNWPNSSEIKEAKELWAKLQILTPIDYLGGISQLLETIESKNIKTDYLASGKTELIYEVPLREIINKNFYDKLKSVSRGFASMNYEILDWREGSFVKLDILLLAKKEEALSKIVSEKEAYSEGKKAVEKLKENLPPQLFAVPIQAAINGKIIARATIKAMRRDVIAPLYGGDYTRKRKLLEIQKKGKKELKERGRIQIPSKVFIEMFRG
ncbi:MAG: elongation factor 4 [Candidatus Nealsonbacteria bacterium RBG_13_42_11]|uniref:Elongation factor 4 n=1 Tax=Candidatus Nealsonbacteria bacterium RBG_13_42_11 TaxID=1801663 RepID=A0A1G2DZS3_9BACT|nr:MAG: elongation factor 4 [Candidatus Nealsonbacteria bacterium RBG_13_42_11]